MKIAIFGLGYVGLTAAGCLTKSGHRVIGVDSSEEKINLLKVGHTPIIEPGLPELIAEAVKVGTLTCSVIAPRDVNTCDAVIVCVGTPSAPDGSHDMRHIVEVTRQIARVIDPNRAKPLTVIYRSTMRPGTMSEMIAPLFEQGLENLAAVELVYNPEFLREATAIQDYFSPPKIVVGTQDGLPSATMDALYADIAAPKFYTGFREAEITKFVDNSFHALKVAFANEIGRTCDALGIDAAKVHEIFVSDRTLNISARYLRPGAPFGGSCLPKDVRALQHMSADAGQALHVVDALIRSNEAHKRFIFDYVTRRAPARARMLMLGVSFKQDTDDLRESPYVDLACKLLRSDYKLSIFDAALDPAKLIGKNLSFAHAHLPTLGDLLISRERCEKEHFDVIIDTHGIARELSLAGDIVIDISRLAVQNNVAAADTGGVRIDRRAQAVG